MGVRNNWQLLGIQLLLLLTSSTLCSCHQKVGAQQSTQNSCIANSKDSNIGEPSGPAAAPSVGSDVSGPNGSQLGLSSQGRGEHLSFSDWSATDSAPLGKSARITDRSGKKDPDNRSEASSMSDAFREQTDGAKPRHQKDTWSKVEQKEDLDQMADAILKRCKPRFSTPLSHLGDILFGMFLSAFIIAVVLYTFRQATFRALWREQKTAAIRALNEMDPETLKKILGEVELPSWVNFPDFERVTWVNSVLKQLWPHVCNAASSYAWSALDPLMKANKPGWIASIKLDRFNLGDHVPHVSSVKVYKDTDLAQRNRIAMEVEFSWASNEEVVLLVRPLPRKLGPATFLANLISSVFQLKVAVEKLFLSGRLRIDLTPLMDSAPFVGALQVALVEEPRYDFRLDVYGGDLTVLPGFELWLHAFVRDSVLRPYTLPERYTIPIAGQPEGFDRPRGMLFVKLIEAVNVPRMDLFSNSDPYVKLSVRAKRKMKSQVRQNTRHPVWNEHFEFVVHMPEVQHLEAVLYDFDVMNPDDEIGRATVPIRELPNGECRDLWLDVRGPDDRAAGDLAAAKNVAVRAMKKITKLAQRPAREKAKSCRLHMEVTYYEFPEEGSVEAEGSVPERVRNLLKGGVLYLRVKKATALVHKKVYKGGFVKGRITVEAEVAGERKSTVAVKGSDEAVWDETLEWVLGEVDLQRQDAGIKVEVWDKRLVNDFKGRVCVPLKDVVERRHVSDNFQLEGVAHGFIALELEWMGIMSAG